MPNISKPQGIVPVQHLTGAPFNGQGRIYAIYPSLATKLRPGDPVSLTGPAAGATAGAGSDPRGYAYISLWTNATPLLGSIMAIGRNPTALAQPNNPNLATFPAGGDGTTDPWYALVADAPDLIFEINEHSNGTQLAANNVGALTTFFAGSTSPFLSDFQLASVTDQAPGFAPGLTLPLRLLGLSREPGNTFGPDAKWLVTASYHALASSTPVVQD